MSDDASVMEFLDRFANRYQKVMAPVSLEIEEESLGTRCGASSWSTPEQVAAMARASGLKTGDHFLDIGSGAGWPGARIAQLTGAGVTLSDITEEGLVVAAQMHPGSVVVQSDASRLPFADGSFDAITHSDVLCCLPEKEETLRECRRVLSDGGVMVFAVIAARPGLRDEEVAVLQQSGNEFLFADRPYPALLDTAGFEFEIEDVTAEFTDLAGRLHKARSSRLDELVELWGPEDAKFMVERAAFNQAASRRGDMIRHFVVARPAS